MDGSPYQHVPVLPGPAIAWLDLKPAGCYVDCTAGAGGHAALIAQQLTTGRLIALDRDPNAVAAVAKRLAHHPGVEVVHANYGALKQVLMERRIDRVDGVLLDAGISSVQLDDPGRGFTFQQEGPLDMRLDTTAPLDAAAYIAGASEDELAEALRSFGDIRPTRRIARALRLRSANGQLNTTSDLVAAVQEALSFTSRMPEEVRTVFQAVRMAVNEELRFLEAGLRQGMDVLAPGGRMAVISFHSGEDRVVKRVFAAASKPLVELQPDGRVRRKTLPAFRVLTPKPVVADDAETARNPRAKSAKLRVIERKAEGE